MRGQRGFTLIETIVVAAILAVLAMVAVISLAQRPGSLRAAVDGYDASLAAARAIAATSGNGATLVFAARTTGNTALPGFTLTVYRGRPTAVNAVTATTVMAVSSDASVSEVTLGKPTFAIFLSSAGHASGQAAYPVIDRNGVATFATIATQPACPAGGFVLIFAGAHATQTRSLPCRVSVASSPLPLTSMAPSPIVLTPASLTYYWPGAPQQHFVATEWGYTRWFAAAAWSCGSNVAAFPQTLPAPPYSPAYSNADATALPLPPGSQPYSFAYSTESMEDAPAWFYLAPQTAGLCTSTIADAGAQHSTVAVHVMGWLTLGQGGSSATSQTSALILSGVTLQNTGDNVSISASKSDDDDPAGIFASASNVTISNNCASFMTGSVAGTSLAGSGETATSNAGLTLAVANGGNTGASAASCTATVTDRYNEPPVSIAFTVESNTPPVATWPAELVLGAGQSAFSVTLAGTPVGYGGLGSLLNRALGGGIAGAAGTGQCYARGTLSDGQTVDPSLPSWVSAQTGVYYDTASGCEVDINDNPLPASSVGMITYTANQASVTYNVQGAKNTCASSGIARLTGWVPANAVGITAVQGAQGVSAGNCSVTLGDGDGTQPVSPDNGLVALNVDGGPCSDGETLPIGDYCSITLPANVTGANCDPSGGDSGSPTISYYLTLGGYSKVAVTSTSNATLGSMSVSRTAAGPIEVTQMETILQPGYTTNKFGVQTCTFTNTDESDGSINLN